MKCDEIKPEVRKCSRYSGTVTYHGDDDLIWIVCENCGWRSGIDFYPSLAMVNEIWQRHLQLVTVDT